MKTRAGLGLFAIAVLLLPSSIVAGAQGAGSYKLVGWNNLGMHCMDADFSLFSILPPYNTIHAQLVDANGHLVTSATGIAVTYQAIADPQASVNTTSKDKTNFWQFVQDLFGVSPAVDTGLAGTRMPGQANTPQPMTFDPVAHEWVGEGIPITPYDDAGNKNAYPLMRLVANESTGAVLATTDIVLPVSDEMDCRACHASGTVDAARPKAGWANNPNPQIDYRMNILALHDDRRDNQALYQAKLAEAGYDQLGLYQQAFVDGHPILCAKCHSSNALPGTGLAGVAPLTQAVHGLHDVVLDPTTGMSLGNSQNRSACYRCHPGATTRCLRGAMGSAVAPDGTMAMQCQSCHGSMSQVGALGRQGWLDEPGCQNCHTGNAMSNGGQIRFTSAIDNNGRRRVPADTTFATNPDVPAAGFSLYRFSHGHGGLNCEACHGSTHAEYPSSHANDNIQSTEIQGHVGVIADCVACHAGPGGGGNQGPHGMHPVGQYWVDAHPDQAENSGTGRCRNCHGADYKGTELSRSLGDRQISSEFGSRFLWRGFQVGCYACHNGPGSESANPNRTPKASDLTVVVAKGASKSVNLSATDADRNPLTFRIVSQPAHGTVGLSGSTATYFAEAGFGGTDGFTYAAWDGQIDSNLASVNVTVSSQPCAVTCSATVPPNAQEGVPVSFQGSATATGCTEALAFSWVFGDGQDSTQQNASHAYALSGAYNWKLSAAADGVACTRNGTIAVEGTPPSVTRVKRPGGGFSLVIIGSNFHAGIQVAIGGVPWAGVTRKGSTQLTLTGGSALKALFPPKTWVRIVLTNPDDGLSVGIDYNRSTGKFRPATP